MDTREHRIAGIILERIAAVLVLDPPNWAGESLSIIGRHFDEQVVTKYIHGHHGLRLDPARVLDRIHELAEQTYENQALAFGCILDPTVEVPGLDPVFPSRLLQSKKYRALSDGYRTAYHVSTEGSLLGFVDLRDRAGRRPSAKHFFPHWAEDLASWSRDGCCGLTLTTNGDILVFDSGSMTLTCRFGRWQLWSHGALIALLQDLFRGRRVSRETSAKLARTIYRAALDAAFRRHGALFVVLNRQRDVPNIMNDADGIADQHRDIVDAQFDAALKNGNVTRLSRAVLAELASLDGAVVVSRNGLLHGYGAVLRPRRQGKLRGTEGSRTKAAIGASHYGVAVKVSSDGDISIYSNGRLFLKL